MTLSRHVISGLGMLIAVAALTPLASGKNTSPRVDGGTVFKKNCAECHTGGGNLVNQAKPVAESSKLASIATFKAYLKSPTGHMPYYKHIINDRKTLEALYDYCKTLKPPKQA